SAVTCPAITPTACAVASRSPSVRVPSVGWWFHDPGSTGSPPSTRPSCGGTIGAMARSDEGTMSPRHGRATTGLAWGLFAAGAIALVAAFFIHTISHRPVATSDITGPLGFLTIGIAGLAIALRRPENAVGWLYLAVWVAIGLTFGLGTEYGYW